jgi:hypothetical protein
MRGSGDIVRVNHKGSDPVGKSRLALAARHQRQINAALRG